MISDVAMSDCGEYVRHETNKRAIDVTDVTNEADERIIKRASPLSSTTYDDDAMTETKQMSDVIEQVDVIEKVDVIEQVDVREQVDVIAFGDLRIVLPSRHDTPFQVEVKSRQSKETENAEDENAKLYIAGLHFGGGLALAPHHFPPYPDETTEPSVAERRAEVLAVIGAMLASVDETTARLTRQSTAMRSSMTFDRDDVRAKLTYIRDAGWKSFMGVDFPGSASVQFFPCYQALLSS
jgi:hypothetical protein